MIAEQFGHVVPIDQPEVIVNAIRTVVETVRGPDVPPLRHPCSERSPRPTSAMNLRSGKA